MSTEPITAPWRDAVADPPKVGWFGLVIAVKLGTVTAWHLGNGTWICNPGMWRCTPLVYADVPETPAEICDRLVLAVKGPRE